MNDLQRSFGDWVSWITSEKRLSKNTVTSYQKDLTLFFKFLSNHYSKEVYLCDLTQLSEDDITSWFSERLRKGITHRSNARSLSSIKSFFRFLEREKKIKFKGVISRAGPKFEGSLPRPISEKQVNLIINEIKKEKVEWVLVRNLSIVLLMWGYGLRIGEVLNIKVKDLFSEAIEFHGKGDKKRLIPIHNILLSFMKEILKMRK